MRAPIFSWGDKLSAVELAEARLYFLAETHATDHITLYDIVECSLA